MAAQLEFRLLGDVEARIGGQVVDLGHARQRCVLVALLVDANHVVPVDQVVDRVWADRTPHRAREALYSYLSRLRHALTTNTDVRITRQPGGYLLAVDPMTVDLYRFRRLTGQARTAADDVVKATKLEQALRLWRGPAFTALDTPWLNSVRDALDRERVANELDRNDLVLQRGRHTELLPDLATAAAARPLDERLAGQLMLALYRSGRQCEALDAYRKVRRTFSEELGIDPGRELHRLEAAILAHDPRLDFKEPPAASASPAASAGPARAWNVPLRNPHFTGRSGMLDELHRRFRAGTNGPMTQTIYGLGGVGKTQLVLEYAHRFAADYQLVWWIAAEHQVLISDQFISLAGRLSLPTGGSAADVVGHVLAELSRQPGCLLIFDNAERPEDIIGYLPAKSAHALVTSRFPGWGALGGRMAIDVMARAETIDLLRARSPEMSVEVANGLADELGDLPLAAAQAAGYLEQTGLTPGDYLERFRSRRTGLLSRGDVLGYEDRVDTTWVISLDRLSRDDPVAVALLECAAFLAPEPIPVSLFTDHPEQLDTGIGSFGAADPDAVGDAIGAAVGFSLVRRHADGFQMHRLVQQVIRSRLPSGRRTAIERRIIALVGAACPGDPFDPALEQAYARLAPHVLAIGSLGDASPVNRRLLLATCDYLSLRGHLESTRLIAEDVLQRWRRALGPDHGDTLNAAACLTSILALMGQAEKASDLGMATWQRSKRVLGADHPTTLRLTISVAVPLIWQGEAKQARSMTQRAVDRYHVLCGSDRPETLSAEARLTAVMVWLAEYENARKLGLASLQRATRVLGPDHPTTLRLALNSAFALACLGQAEPARSLAEDVMNRCRRLMGPDHRFSLTAAIALSQALIELGAIEQAFTIARDALERFKRTRGPDHPDTLFAAAIFALALAEMGETDQARNLAQDTLDRSLLVLGPDQPDTLNAVGILATVHNSLAAYDHARKLSLGSLPRATRLLGPDHPITLRLAVNSAVALDGLRQTPVRG